MISMKYCIFSAALIALVHGAPADKKGLDLIPAPTCQGTSMTFYDDLKKAVELCYTKYNPGSTIDDAMQMKVAAKNETCMMQCAMQQLGLMSDDYKIVPSKITDHLKKLSIPEKAIAPLTEAVNTCITAEKGATYEMKDGKCDSIMTFIRCTGEAAGKICEPAKV